MELMFLFCEWGRLQIRVVLAHAKKKKKYALNV